MIPIRNVITTIGKITHKRIAGSKTNSAILNHRQMTQQALPVLYTGIPIKCDFSSHRATRGYQTFKALVLFYPEAGRGLAALPGLMKLGKRSFEAGATLFNSSLVLEFTYCFSSPFSRFTFYELTV